MDVVSVIKEHPIPITIGAVVVLALIFGSRSSGSSSGNASAMLQSQSIATQGNVAIAKVRAEQEAKAGDNFTSMFNTSQTVSASLAAKRTDAATHIFDSITSTDAQLALADKGSILQRYMAQLSAQTSADQMAKQYSLASKNIDAGVDVAKSKMATALSMQANDNNTKLSMLGMQLGEKKYETDVTAANLPTLLQHSENLSKISADNAQAIVAIQTAAARQQASANANSTNVNTLSNLLGMLGYGGSSGNSGGGGGGFDFGDVVDVGSTILSFI